MGTLKQPGWAGGNELSPILTVNTLKALLRQLDTRRVDAAARIDELKAALKAAQIEMGWYLDTARYTSALIALLEGPIESEEVPV